MAKRKSKEPEPPKQKRRCFFCDGTGGRCQVCGESEAACTCDEGECEIDDCPECKGTGIASADMD